MSVTSKSQDEIITEFMKNTYTDTFAKDIHIIKCMNYISKYFEDKTKNVEVDYLKLKKEYDEITECLYGSYTCHNRFVISKILNKIKTKSQSNFVKNLEQKHMCNNKEFKICDCKKDFDFCNSSMAHFYLCRNRENFLKRNKFMAYWFKMIEETDDEINYILPIKQEFDYTKDEWVKEQKNLLYLCTNMIKKKHKVFSIIQLFINSINKIGFKYNKFLKTVVNKINEFKNRESDMFAIKQILLETNQDVDIFDKWIRIFQNKITSRKNC